MLRKLGFVQRRTNKNTDDKSGKTSAKIAVNIFNDSVLSMTQLTYLRTSAGLEQAFRIIDCL